MSHLHEGNHMAFIKTISASWVTGDAFAMYERQQRHYGYVPNYATVFSHRPEVMRRWGELLAALKRPMDKRRQRLWRRSSQSN